MAKSMVRYELFTDPSGEEPFKRMGVIYSSKVAALKGLRTYLPWHPSAYLARVVFTRGCGPQRVK